MNRIFRTEPEASADSKTPTSGTTVSEPDPGIEFVEAVDAALEQIAARRFPITRFPYHIVCLEWVSVIRILAFAHDRRRPVYWLSRV